MFHSSDTMTYGQYNNFLLLQVYLLHKTELGTSRGWLEVYLYSSMTVALEGGEWSAAHPGRTLPREIPGTHFTGGWVGPRAGLTGGKSRSHRDSIPDRPARSQSLYRQRYPTHKSKIYEPASSSCIVYGRFKKCTYIIRILKLMMLIVKYTKGYTV